MLVLIPILIAYFLGAIPVGLIVARRFGIDDIRTQGSGNIGATNVGRVLGFRASLWVYAGDIGKGILAVLIARQFDQYFGSGFLATDQLLVLTAVVAVAGNVFPVYIKFKGGKGVNTGLGAVITLLPYETLLAIGLFLVVFLVTRYVSAGSIVGGISLFALVAVEKYVLAQPIAGVYIWLTLLLALMILVTHRQNIIRLFSGTENRVSFGSGQGGSRG